MADDKNTGGLLKMLGLPPRPKGAAAATTDVPPWDVVATPSILRFPATEVGAVSAPLDITLTNRGATQVHIASLTLVPQAGAAASLPGEFELVGPPGLPALLDSTLRLQVVFLPARVVPAVRARLRIQRANAARDEHVDVVLKAVPAAPLARHADLRELSVAQHAARQLASTPTPNVRHYGGMLAAVLAAADVSNGSEGSATVIVKLLEPVARRLDELNDHQGRFAQFGAGNIAGQAAIDMAQAAVDSWLRLTKLGARTRPQELVMRFRAGAEAIRFLTGERTDAPTLRGFDDASRVGIAALAVAPLAVAAVVGTALVAGPAVLALAAEEAPLLAFVGRAAGRNVALWALRHPAAALAAAEALLGLGIQIGEDGWEDFWDGVRSHPEMFLMRVLMDYMHVKSGMHADAPAAPRRLPAGTEPEPGYDINAARQATRQARETLQKVQTAVDHDHDEILGSGSDRPDDKSLPRVPLKKYEATRRALLASKNPPTYQEGKDAEHIHRATTVEGRVKSGYLPSKTPGKAGILVYSDLPTDPPSRLDYIHELVHLGQDRRGGFVGVEGLPGTVQRKIGIAKWEIGRIEQMKKLPNVKWTEQELAVLDEGLQKWTAQKLKLEAQLKK